MVIPDADKYRFAHQARREGMSLSAWLREAAHERLERSLEFKKFQSAEEVREFLHQCHERAGPGREPDWEEHLTVMNESKSRGLPDV